MASEIIRNSHSVVNGTLMAPTPGIVGEISHSASTNFPIGYTLMVRARGAPQSKRVQALVGLRAYTGFKLGGNQPARHDAVASRVHESVKAGELQAIDCPHCLHFRCW